MFECGIYLMNYKLFEKKNKKYTYNVLVPFKSGSLSKYV